MRKLFVVLAAVVLTLALGLVRANAHTICSTSSAAYPAEAAVEGLTGDSEDPVFGVLDTADTAAGLADAVC
jgi:hypothetical protein